MMNNRKIYFIKALIIYLFTLSIFVCSVLLIRIGDIINNLNLFFLSLLLINVFIAATNGIFLFRKNSAKDYKMVLLYNAIFSLISGFQFRAFGYIVANNLGADFSIMFMKNSAGSGFAIHYDSFNVIEKLLFYDNIKMGGFSIQINLIMLLISVCLFYFYNKIKKTGMASPSTPPG